MWNEDEVRGTPSNAPKMGKIATNMVSFIAVRVLPPISVALKVLFDKLRSEA